MLADAGCWTILAAAVRGVVPFGLAEVLDGTSSFDYHSGVDVVFLEEALNFAIQFIIDKGNFESNLLVEKTKSNQN